MDTLKYDWARNTANMLEDHLKMSLDTMQRACAQSVHIQDQTSEATHSLAVSMGLISVAGNLLRVAGERKQAYDLGLVDSAPDSYREARLAEAIYRAAQDEVRWAKALLGETDNE